MLSGTVPEFLYEGQWFWSSSQYRPPSDHSGFHKKNILNVTSIVISSVWISREMKLWKNFPPCSCLSVFTRSVSQSEWIAQQFNLKLDCQNHYQSEWELKFCQVYIYCLEHLKSHNEHKEIKKNNNKIIYYIIL